MPDFFELLFNDIAKNIDRRRENGYPPWTELLLLRSKNFKGTAAALSPDDIANSPSLRPIVRTINELIENELLKTKEKIDGLSKISGIGFAFSTTLLALSNPKKWAILDSRIIKYFSYEQVIQNLPKIFNNPNFNQLYEQANGYINNIKDNTLNLINIEENNHIFLYTKMEAEWNSGRLFKAYKDYIKLLIFIQERCNKKNLRRVEIKIWKKSIKFINKWKNGEE